jgi:hypothetical protein
MSTESTYRVIYRSHEVSFCFFPYIIETCESFAHATGIYFGFRNYPEMERIIHLVIEFDDRSVICDTYRD